MQSTNGTDPQPPPKHSKPVQQNGPVMQPPPHPWMPYAAAPMVMQHQMMPPQHYPAPQYMPYHHYMPVQQHQLQQQQQQHGGANGDNKTIWIGDLQPWMDESYLHNCFVSTGEVNGVKIIRNKQTGLSEGYGFAEFNSHTAAEKVLQEYATVIMPNTEQLFRLNWASFTMGEKRSDNGPDLSIFVGDLTPDVTDTLLHETFSSKYPSVKAAKVVIDANTGRSKGYGFVRFGDDSERSQAMAEMNGVMCSTRAMRIGPATPRKSFGHQQGGFASNGHFSDGDSTNTTVFVGNLDPNVTDEDLKQPFSQYGEILSVKIPPGKGCGFVQFAARNNAEEAMQNLHATTIGNQTVRLSWGRNPANKQMRGDFGNQWNGPPFYGMPQMYDEYGYGIPSPVHPSMFAAGYGPYPFFGNPQQPQVS